MLKSSEANGNLDDFVEMYKDDLPSQSTWEAELLGGESPGNVLM